MKAIKLISALLAAGVVSTGAFAATSAVESGHAVSAAPKQYTNFVVTFINQTGYTDVVYSTFIPSYRSFSTTLGDYNSSNDVATIIARGGDTAVDVKICHLSGGCTATTRFYSSGTFIVNTLKGANVPTFKKYS